MLINNKGQATLPEYVVTFFLVIGVVVAMGLYIQRGLQARMRDARLYMVSMATNACDTNCMNAAGVMNRSSLPEEYEPYYAQVQMVTSRASIDNSQITGGDGGSIGIFEKRIDQITLSNTTSTQLPPVNAEQDKF